MSWCGAGDNTSIWVAFPNVKDEGFLILRGFNEATSCGDSCAFELLPQYICE